MDRETFHLFNDDKPEEIADRLRLSLAEMGIKMKEIGQGINCRIYEFTKMPPLFSDRSN
jgi:hypothetical protein